MPPLSEQRRAQLDAIVNQMAVNHEPDENVQAVVNDFKSKYADEGGGGDLLVDNVKNLAGAAKDFAVGAARGAGQTITALGDLARKVPGVSALDKVLTPTTFSTDPANTAQRVGKFVEQGAEYAVPAGLADRAALTIASKAPAVIRLAARAAANAGAAAGVAGAHGDDPTMAAVLGGAVPVVGAAVGAAKPILGRAASALDEIAGNKLTRAVAPLGRSATALRMSRQVQDAAPDLLRQPGVTGWSRAGYQRALGEGLDDAKAGLDSAMDQRISHRAIDTSDILTRLSDAQDQYVSRAAEGSTHQPVPAAIKPGVVDGELVNTPETGLTTRGQGVDRPVKVGEIVDNPSDHVIEGSAYRDRPIGRDIVPPEKRPGYDMLSRTIEEIQALGGEPHQAHYDALANIRSARDLSAQKIYTPSVVADFGTQRAEGVGASQAAGAIRDSLAETDPVTAAANRQYHLYKGPHDATVARGEIESAAPSVGRRIFSRMAGATAGAAAGGPTSSLIGAAVGPAFDQLLSSLPTTQIKQARGLAALADALRGAKVDPTAARLALLRGLLSHATHPDTSTLEDELLRRQQP